MSFTWGLDSSAFYDLLHFYQPVKGQVDNFKSLDRKELKLYILPLAVAKPNVTLRTAEKNTVKENLDLMRTRNWL